MATSDQDLAGIEEVKPLPDGVTWVVRYWGPVVRFLLFMV